MTMWNKIVPSYLAAKAFFHTRYPDFPLKLRVTVFTALFQCYEILSSDNLKSGMAKGVNHGNWSGNKIFRKFYLYLLSLSFFSAGTQVIFFFLIQFIRRNDTVWYNYWKDYTHWLYGDLYLGCEFTVTIMRLLFSIIRYIFCCSIFCVRNRWMLLSVCCCSAQMPCLELVLLTRIFY